MKFRLVLFLAAIVGCVSQIYSAEAAEYTMASEPAWAAPAQLPEKGWAQRADHTEGVAYLLLDRQYLVDSERQKLFVHFAEQAVNPSGVGEISHISIEFDPLYEKLSLHKLVIHRNGEVIDYLSRAKINLIQRETGLDRQIYDGEQTLNIFIEDVRVGDIVEHSYTLAGANPAFNGHFAEALATQWAVPVGRVHYSILWSRDKTLYFKTANSNIKPQIEFDGDVTRYTWRYDDVEGLLLGDTSNAPAWHQPYGRLYLSDYVSWSEVSRWGWQLYRQDQGDALVKETATALSKGTRSEEERILAVLRFVQDEIRYLGMEMGLHSFKPTSSGQVIVQRYGDCKGKAALMVELLRELGIKAQPALVHNSKGLNRVQLLPTPKAFNHVIVFVESEGERYWLDPTLSYQRGELDGLYQPDYGYAVRISETGYELEKMFENRPSLHKKEVTEIFDLSSKTDDKVKYTINTRHERRFADHIRRNLSESSRKEIEQSYLDYTARYYPDVERIEGLQIIDDEKNNTITEVEHYRISKIWEQQQDDSYEYAGFEPYLLYSYIHNDVAVRRSVPLELSHPIQIRQTTIIKLPEGFVFEEQHQQIIDKAFRFSYDVHYEDATLVLEYSYQSLSDHVLPEDLVDYAGHMDQAYDLLGFWIQQPSPNPSQGHFGIDTSDLNTGMLVTVYSTAVLVCGIMWWLIFFYDPGFARRQSGESKTEGIRGWLVMPGVALAMCPVLVIWLNWEAGFLFSASQWAQLGQQFGSSMQLMVALQMIGVVFLLLFPLGLLVLYLSRRSTFPKLFLLYLLVWQLFVISDGAAIWLFDVADPETVRAGVQQFLGVTLAVLVSGAYLLRSDQVKVVFNQRKPPSPDGNIGESGEENEGVVALGSLKN